MTTRQVLDRYDAAGGGLLAGGLAYSALFAIVPLTLLIAGIIGLLVADPAERTSVVEAIADVLPPVRDLVRLILDEAAGAAGALSVLGAIALVWGASRFVVSFEDAIGRIFGGERRRSFMARNAVGLGAVVGLIVAVVLGTFVTGLASFLAVAEEGGGRIVGVVGGLVLGFLPVIVAVVALGMVYRLVPVLAPRWGAIAPPALVVAVVLSLLTKVFVFLAPRLIGAAATLGTIATAFAALAWLGLSFQAVLIGAAWVRERDRTWGEPAGVITEPPADAGPATDPASVADPVAHAAGAPVDPGLPPTSP